MNRSGEHEKINSSSLTAGGNQVRALLPQRLVRVEVGVPESRPLCRSNLTTRQACDRLGYSRPDSRLRAWRSRGLPVYLTVTGLYRLALADVKRLISECGDDMTKWPTPKHFTSWSSSTERTPPPRASVADTDSDPAIGD